MEYSNNRNMLINRNHSIYKKNLINLIHFILVEKCCGHCSLGGLTAIDGQDRHPLCGWGGTAHQ